MAKTRRPKGAGSIFQDAENPKRWIGKVRIDGRLRKVSGTSRTDVQKKLDALKAKAATGDLPSQSITVKKLVDIFMERRLPNIRVNGRPLAPASVQVYQWAAKIIAAEIGTRKVDSLTIDNVESMLDRLADGGMSKASLHKVKSKLGQFIDEGRRRKYVRDNVARDATLPGDRSSAAGFKAQAERTALKPDEARTLLEALRSERNGLMYALSLTLGLRPGEAAGLFWRDVDLDGATPSVNVTRGVQRDSGQIGISDELKTGKAKRTIELTPDLVDWFRVHRRAQLTERMAADRWLDDRLVFTTPTGHVTDPARNRRNLVRICKTTKVPQVRPNELRHSCASLLADQGVPNESIADLLGHTTTRMVDQTYLHRLRPVVSVATLATWTQAN